MPTKRQILETFFERVWSQEDASAIDELFKPDGKAEGLGAQALIGPEDFKVFHQALCSLLSNIETSIDKCIEQGDWISVLLTIRAKDTNTGQNVSFSGNCFGIIKNGLIVEAYNNLDFMGLFCQLGYLPEGSFEKGLSGCKII